MTALRIGIADHWNSFHIKEYREQLRSTPVELVVEDADRLLHDPGIHALIFAPQPGFFFPALCTALENGKHVFCDKCVSLTETQIDALYACAEKRGLHIAFEFPFLHRPAFRVAYRFLSDGALGDVSSAHLRNAHNGLISGTLPPQFLSDPHGVLYDIGIHPLYTALALFGMPEKTLAHAVFAPGCILHSYHALLSGPARSIVCEGSYCSQEAGFSLSIYGTQGYLHAGTCSGKFTFQCPPALEKAAEVSLLRKTEESDLQLWVEQIQKGTAPVQSDIMLAKQTAALVEEIYRLSRS